MTTVNAHEAVGKLMELLARVRAGEEIVIAEDGVPVARLVPEGTAPAPRRPVSARGLIGIGPDFDDPLPDDIARGFGGTIEP